MTADPAGFPEVSVRVVRLAHAVDLPLPEYASAAAAGMDVRAAVTEPIRLEPGTIARIPTGLVVEVPEGYELQLRPRSGLAARDGVTLANSPATIDADYRGEVFVALIHHGVEPIAITRGMRIAQMILARVPRIRWQESDALSVTARGAGGFGHTGTE